MACLNFQSTSRAKRSTNIPDRDTAVKATSVLADLVRQLVRVPWPRLREEEGERVAELVHRRDDALRELPFGEAGPSRIPRLGPEPITHFFVDSGAADHGESTRLRGDEEEACLLYT